MSKPLSELRKKIKPEAQTAARAKAVGIVAEMSLAEVRKARGQNQSALAKSMSIAQPNISQMENRPDALIRSSMASYQTPFRRCH
ncbi:transcriptional regulator [Marinomonas sp. GJ51-6]|uniref:transcriptional regulator n=1 Tax=Marinomonas sp. GJ51-6 TaxID=2992802 RepID=UPI0029350EF8|nr:transcriptional regulator [Marinomonas sp. GJ51-6]WOD07661.1 transcriptional regulator [Marinomonas sp. GJ51-6]